MTITGCQVFKNCFDTEKGLLKWNKHLDGFQVCFRLEPIFTNAPAASKNDDPFKSVQKWLNKNHLTLIVSVNSYLWINIRYRPLKQVTKNISTRLSISLWKEFINWLLFLLKSCKQSQTIINYETIYFYSICFFF